MPGLVGVIADFEIGAQIGARRACLLIPSLSFDSIFGLCGEENPFQCRMATRSGRRGRGRAKAIEDKIDAVSGENDLALIEGASRGRRATRSATARASAGSQKKGEAHSSRGSDATSSPGSSACRGKDDSQTNAWDMRGGSARSSAHCPDISVDSEGIPCKSARLPRRADPGNGGRPDPPAQSRHSPVANVTILEDQGHVLSPQVSRAWAPPGKHEDSLAAKLSLGCGAAIRPNRPSLAAAGAVPIKQRKMMLMNALSGSSGGSMIDTSPSMAAACGVFEYTAAMAPGIDSNTLSDAHIRATLLEAELAAAETDDSQSAEELDGTADSFLSIVAAKGAMTPGITGRMNQRMRELHDVVQKLGCEESLSPYVLTSGSYGDKSSTSPAWSAPVEAAAATASNRELYARRDDDDDDDHDHDDEVAFTKLDKRFSNITSRRSTRASSRITFELKQPSPPLDANLDSASAMHHPAYGRRVLSAFGRSVYGALSLLIHTRSLNIHLPVSPIHIQKCASPSSISYYSVTRYSSTRVGEGGRKGDSKSLLLRHRVITDRSKCNSCICKCLFGERAPVARTEVGDRLILTLLLVPHPLLSCTSHPPTTSDHDPCSRMCDMDRVKEMAASKMQSPVFPGAVSVFQYPPGTKTSSNLANMRFNSTPLVPRAVVCASP